MAGFAPRQDGVLYLTEGGQETEIMYRHGHRLPEFAMFPLLEDAAAVADLTTMYSRVFEVAAENGMHAMITGLDYRGSPDWGDKLGYSREALADALMRGIDFLRAVARPYENDVPGILIGGQIGPRGDAYELGHTITAEEAEEYHAFQMAVHRRAEVDFVWAATFNNVPEAIGTARAAASAGLPLGLSFMLDGEQKLLSGTTLKDAIEAVDAATGGARPDYYSINCSHPLEFEPALDDGAWVERIRCLRPNASAKDKIELCTLGHLEEGDPVDLGRRMGDLARRYPGIDMFGGCCGTWDKHLAQIARNVRRAAA